MPTTPDPSTWPAYCCAILRDKHGRYLMEKRPPSETRHGTRITCFGGTRHEGEHPDTCIQRELIEELAWSPDPATLHLCLRLLGPNDRVIAWFYRSDAPPPEHPITTEPGVEPLWLTFEQTQGDEVSEWHHVALAAERIGDSTAHVAK